MVTLRIGSIWSENFHGQFPGTAALFKKLSEEMFALDASQTWYNASNSCREVLKQFASELTGLLPEGVPREIKGADVKALLRHFVEKRGYDGRLRGTLNDLVGAVWDHVQCVLHKHDTSKEEAMRVYLWTGLLISEVYSLHKPRS